MATKKAKEVTEIEEKIEQIEEKVEVQEVKADSTEEFIARKLKVINMMDDKAKAKRLAERVLANRKGIK